MKSNRILLFKGQRVSLKQFIASLPKEAFRKINLKNGTWYWVFTKSVKIPKLGKVRILISYDNRGLSGEPVTLVSNWRDWEAVKIVSTYLLRSGIDRFLDCLDISVFSEQQNAIGDGRAVDGIELTSPCYVTLVNGVRGSFSGFFVKVQ